jgi:hypothetical protein
LYTERFPNVDAQAGMTSRGIARAAMDDFIGMAKAKTPAYIRQSNRFNRRLRDLRTITQHAYLSADRYEDVGAIALGQPPRWGFLQM